MAPHARAGAYRQPDVRSDSANWGTGRDGRGMPGEVTTWIEIGRPRDGVAAFADARATRRAWLSWRRRALAPAPDSDGAGARPRWSEDRCRLGDDRPAEHHGVVLVEQVVAVATYGPAKVRNPR